MHERRWPLFRSQTCAVIQAKITYQDYTHVVMGVFKETFTTNLPEAEE